MNKTIEFIGEVICIIAILISLTIIIIVKDERKTKIVAAEGEIDLEDLIKEEQCVVALTHFGYIKRMPIDTYKSQRRGGKGITGIATREDDF